MPWWFTALLFVGSFIASELLRPKPNIENARPKNLGDFQFPTATEGRKIPLVWGSVQLKGPNVIWYGDLEARAIVEEVAQNIFQSEDVIKGYNYLVGMQLALCRGPINEIRRIWVGDELLLNVPNLFTLDGDFVTMNFPNFFGGDDVGGNGGLVGTLRAYMGTETQGTNTYLAGFQSPLPAYRGTAYVVYEKGTIGNSTSIQPWKFEVRRLTNPLNLTGGDEDISNGHMNPMNVIYEILTNDEWGLNLPASDIDTDNFTAVAATLAGEGNGFSFLLDNVRDVVDVVREIERQIDGFLFFNRSTAKWQVNLARGGYSIPSLQEVNESNLLEINNWSRGSWDDTTNQVNIKFSYFDTSSLDWKETSARAQDNANFLVQGGRYASADEDFPGVKIPALANHIAWRELRGRSRPFASGTIVVNREFYDVNPGDVLRLTYGDDLNYTDFPIRVNKVDLGELGSGQITLQVSEDVFAYEPGSYADPPNSGWIPPFDDLVAIPTDEDIVMESPRAFTLRSTSPSALDRIWCGAVNQGDAATSFRAWIRHAAGVPSGTYVPDQEVFTFIRLGTLNITLAQDTANPTTPATQDIRVNPVTPIADILARLQLTASAGDMGQNLVNLLMIEDEFLLATEVIDQTTYLDLRSVYRGALDSVAREHAAGANVFVVVGGIGRLIYPRGHNVDVQLRSRSKFDEVAGGEANTVQLTLVDRGRAPYPPQDMNIEGSRYPAGPISLDNTTASGSGLDDVGFDVSWTRRDFAMYDEIDNVNGVVGSGFPTTNNTRHRVTVVDITGAPATLFSTAFAQQASDVVTRTEILANTDGVIPTDLRVLVNTRHDYDASITDVNAVQDERWEFPVTSAALSGLDNTGARAVNTPSASFTADVTATYTFEIGTDLLTTGNLQVRLNVGGWTNVITSGGGTSGTIAITAGDTVEWQHTESAGSGNTHLRIHHGGTNEAYGVLIV